MSNNLQSSKILPQILLALVVFLPNLPALADDEQFRDWTSKSGSKTKARLIAVEEGLVVIEKASGGISKVELSKLSEIDQKFVAKVMLVDPNASLKFGKIITIDGSNLKIEDRQGETFTVSLAGVEMGSGELLEEALIIISSSIDSYCQIEWKSRKDDIYVGMVYVEGKCINLNLIAKGLARYKPSLGVDERLEHAQTVAKKKRYGIWK